MPYRDSKLTRILQVGAPAVCTPLCPSITYQPYTHPYCTLTALQSALGGNAKTAIICAMTPASCHLEESHSTVRPKASRCVAAVHSRSASPVLLLACGALLPISHNPHLVCVAAALCVPGQACG